MRKRTGAFVESIRERRQQVAADFSALDLSKIKYWQVMDPAPEFMQMIDDPILVAGILKAQVELKQESMRSQMKAFDNYYASVNKMLDKVIQKGPSK
jgi:hypothetical protein